jgi:hypothetical protein
MSLPQEKLRQSSTERHQPPEIITAAILGFTLRDCLNLYESDARVIERDHGLSVEQQDKAGIRSAPSSVEKIFARHAVLSRFGDRDSYPAPFFHDANNQLQLNLSDHGLIVPCCRGGLMRTWLHYRYPNDAAPVWCSGSKYGGEKAKPSIHVCLAENVKKSGVAVLVRDALAAITCAGNGAVCFVGLNGVAPHTLTAQLRAALPDLRAVLLDLDSIEPRLTRALEFAGLRWEVL